MNDLINISTDNLQLAPRTSFWVRGHRLANHTIFTETPIEKGNDIANHKNSYKTHIGNTDKKPLTDATEKGYKVQRSTTFIHLNYFYYDKLKNIIEGNKGLSSKFTDDKR